MTSQNNQSMQKMIFTWKDDEGNDMGKRKPLSINRLPDCYLAHSNEDPACSNCFCEEECEDRAGDFD